MENDFLNFSKDSEIITAINSEKILYSNKIQKMNSILFKKERNLIITDSAIYTFQNKKLKKSLKYNDIKALTFSSKSNEFILHRKNQYDFHFSCSDKIKLICALIKAYEKKMQMPITLCEIKEKSLKQYATSKKEKKKDANMSRMDKNKIIDTQTFLIDHEQKNILSKAKTNINTNTNYIFNLNLDEENNNVIKEENSFGLIFYKDNEDICENDLDFINIIGKGKMGKIYLVQNLLNKEYYAMKSLDKNDIEEYSKDNIEKKVKNLNMDFLANIKLCFETKNRIYFCFEFIQNENLFYYNNYQNNTINSINEDKIRFLSASIILALDYLHKNEIIYRNITPNNILITKEGYIKLMTKAGTLTIGVHQAKPQQTATATFENVTIYVPLTGLIDLAKERKRLEKDATIAKANIASRQARLSQENFLKHAPKEQIDKTKAELAAAELALKQAQASLEDLN